MFAGMATLDHCPATTELYGFGLQVTIIYEYCQGPNQMMYSLPAGSFDKQKHADYKACAQSELLEEVDSCGSCAVMCQRKSGHIQMHAQSPAIFLVVRLVVQQAQHLCLCRHGLPAQCASQHAGTMMCYLALHHLVSKLYVNYRSITAFSVTPATQNALTWRATSRLDRR